MASLEKCRAIKLIFFVFLLENNFSNQFAFLTWDRLSSLNTVIPHTAGCHPSICNFPIRQDVIPQHANFPYGRQYGRMSSLNMQISHTSGCHPSNTTTHRIPAYCRSVFFFLFCLLRKRVYVVPFARKSGHYY